MTRNTKDLCTQRGTGTPPRSNVTSLQVQTEVKHWIHWYFCHVTSNLWSRKSEILLHIPMDCLIEIQTIRFWSHSEIVDPHKIGFLEKGSSILNFQPVFAWQLKNEGLKGGRQRTQIKMVSGGDKESASEELNWGIRVKLTWSNAF